MTNGGTLDGMWIEDPYPPTVPPGQDQLPSENGEPMESDRHREQMNLLIDSLRDHWAHRDDFYVAGNMFVYFSELQTRKNDFRGPDVFVALDVVKKDRKSWVLWEEGGRFPNVVIELTSPSTKTIDYEEKLRVYERIWRVSTYVIFDPFTLELTAFQNTADGFAPATFVDGSVVVSGMNLSLGVRPTRLSGGGTMGLRWIDRGAVVMTRDERADTERERANTERERANTERERANTERARADAAEARIRELEALLAKR